MDIVVTYGFINEQILTLIECLFGKLFMPSMTILHDVTFVEIKIVKHLNAPRGAVFRQSHREVKDNFKRLNM